MSLGVSALRRALPQMKSLGGARRTEHDRSETAAEQGRKELWGERTGLLLRSFSCSELPGFQAIQTALARSTRGIDSRTPPPSRDQQHRGCTERERQRPPDGETASFQELQQ